MAAALHREGEADYRYTYRHGRSDGISEMMMLRQCARDVEVTWTPGPGAEPGPRGVVPGREETYPAEGEPIGRDEL